MYYTHAQMRTQTLTHTKKKNTFTHSNTIRMKLKRDMNLLGSRIGGEAVP